MHVVKWQETPPKTIGILTKLSSYHHTILVCYYGDLKTSLLHETAVFRLLGSVQAFLKNSMYYIENSR